MISLEWVKDYIDISDQDLEELAKKITTAGINVEKVIKKNIPNIVVGEVLECIEHPDSDHLHVCQVNVGNEVKQIVCGASNVRKGLKVIVALPGAELPDNFTIKKGKIRGVESDGMLCAIYELGVCEKTEALYNAGIEELPNDIEVGIDANKYLGLDDVLYELDIHKHRNNDCYSHIGFAYEIGAILGREVKLPVSKYSEIEENINNNFNLKIDTDKCSYYLAKMVKDVEVGESPEFMKKRLAAAGMRSINNVVDISNYVMLEYGQPLHFFDKDKLGNNILVRLANDNEELITLDGEKRKLVSSDIVITDGTKPVCLAGVMGGENTEVSENTKNILIESAIFNSVSIRYTSSRLDLRSEASIRYGKGLNFEYTDLAMNRACELLEKYANAKILTGIIKYDNEDKTIKQVEFKTKELNDLLGLSMSDEDVKIELKRLDFNYEYKDNTFTAVIPRRRLDIDPYINDIAEEVGRLYGYHNLVSTLPICATKRGKYIGDVKLKKCISKRLRSLGLNEVKTYTLVSKDMASMFNYDDRELLVLPNPMGADKSVVRKTLIPSLINAYNYNKKRRIKDISFYEIAQTFDKEFNEESKITMLLSGNYISNSWQGSKKIDFYVVKGIVENLLEYLGYKNRYSFVSGTIPEIHPGISAKVLLDREEIGIIGRVHPNVMKDEVYVCELSLSKINSKKIKAIKYKEAPKYPSISKDMAFIVDKKLPVSEIEATIKKTGGRLLNSIDVFDVYTGENVDIDKKSIAFNLVFMDNNKTLTDEEVMSIFNKIIEQVEKLYNAKLRDK